ncbi:hypothetical protein [Streptomyces sp. LARHCF252]
MACQYECPDKDLVEATAVQYHGTALHTAHTQDIPGLLRTRDDAREVFLQVVRGTPLRR